MSRNRNRGQEPENTHSHSSTRTPDIRRGANELGEDSTLTSPSHNTEEEEEQPPSWKPEPAGEHTDRVSDPQSTKKPGTRNSEEAAPESSVQACSARYRDLSQSVQDVHANRQPWSEETSKEQLRTTEYIGPLEAGPRSQIWDSTRQRSQSADSTNAHYQSATLPRSSRIQLAHSSHRQSHSSSNATEAEELATNRSESEHLWDATHPRTPWSDEFAYDTGETSQQSPTAASDMAFFADQPTPSSSKLTFMTDLSQNRQSQSPTEHLRLAINHQDIAIHVSDPQYAISVNSSPRDSLGLSQHTQEEEWAGNTAPPPQQRRHNVGHTHQTSKYVNRSRMTTEVHLGPPGLKSSILAVLSQDHSPPPLTQYYSSQSQHHRSVFGNERHAATQTSEGVAGGRSQRRRTKAHHHRSQERLYAAAARSTSSSSLNRIRSAKTNE